METKIQKWGNSLAVRLPKNLIKKLSLYEGSVVVVNEDRKQRIIITSAPKKTLTLSELVAQITNKNIHSEIEWNSPQGKEVW